MEYTFRPIVKWPRAMTPEADRKVNPFVTPGKYVADGYDATGKPKQRWQAGDHMPLPRTYKDLDRELAHLGVDGTVVVQVALREQDIRLDGRPRAGAPEPKHPGVILNFTAVVGGRKTALQYACDACQRWEDNLRAIVLTLERLRLAGLYGVTKSDEQYTGFRALPGPLVTPPAMTVEDAQRFLGAVGDLVVTDAASYATAYRTAAKRLHPDAGGDPDKWHQLQQAADVLKQHHGIT